MGLLAWMLDYAVFTLIAVVIVLVLEAVSIGLVMSLLITPAARLLAL